MHINSNERSHPRMDIFAITVLATVAGTVMSTYIIRYMDKKAKK